MANDFGLSIEELDAQIAAKQAEVDQFDMAELDAQIAAKEAEVASYDTGYFGALYKGTQQGATSLIRGAASLAEMAGLENDIPERADLAMQQLEQDYPTYSTSKNIVSQVGNMATQLAPALVTGPVTALSTYYGTNLGNQYLDLQNQGASPQDAFTAGAASAGVQTIADVLPVSRASGGLVKRALVAGGGNAALNAMTAPADYLIQDTLTDIEQPLNNNLLGETGNRALIGGLAGAVVGAAKVKSIQEKQNPSDVNNIEITLKNLEDGAIPIDETRLLDYNTITQEPDAFSYGQRSTLSPEEMQLANASQPQTTDPRFAETPNYPPLDIGDQLLLDYNTITQEPTSSAKGTKQYYDYRDKNKLPPEERGTTPTTDFLLKSPDRNKPDYNPIYSLLDQASEIPKERLVEVIDNLPIEDGVNDIDVIDSPAAIKNAYPDAFKDDPADMISSMDNSPSTTGEGDYQISNIFSQPSKKKITRQEAFNQAMDNVRVKTALRKAETLSSPVARNRSVRNGEAGFIDFGFKDLADGIVGAKDKVKQRMNDFFDKRSIGDLATDDTFRYHPYFDSKFRGFTDTEKLMSKDIDTQTIFDKTIEIERKTNQNLFDARQMSKPYFDLPSDKQTKVNSFLLARRKLERNGKRIDMSEANLAKKGYAPDEIAAIKSLQETNDFVFGKLRESALADAEKKFRKKNPTADDDAVLDYLRLKDEQLTEMYDPAYVPYGRNGEYSVRVIKDGEKWNPDGDVKSRAKATESFTLFKTEKEAKAYLKELEDRGVPIERRRFEQIKQNDADLNDSLSLSAKSVLDSLQDDPITGIPIRGAKRYLVHANLTDGYSKDLATEQSRYLSSILAYTARTENQFDITEALSRIQQKTKGRGGLYSEAVKYVNYQSKNTPKFVSWPRKWIALNQIAGVFSTPFINLSTAATNTPSYAYTHLKDPIRTARFVTEATAQAAEYLGRLAKASTLDKDGAMKPIKMSDPKLSELLFELERDGTISKNSYFQEMAADKSFISGGLKNLNNVLFFAMKTSEKFVSTQAAITAYKIAKDLGLKNELDFARVFVRRTQFPNTKATRLGAERGIVGGIGLTLRTFPIKQISFLKTMLEKKQFAAFAGSMVAMGAIGGLKAWPFVGDLISTLEAAGFDGAEELKDYFDADGVGSDIIDAGFKGLPYLAGWDTSMAMASQIAPDTSQGYFQAAARFIGGAAAGEIAKLDKFAKILTDSPAPMKEKAIKGLFEISPKFVQRASRAGYYLADNGTFTNAFGDTLFDPSNPSQKLKFTELQMAGIATGFFPANLSKAYSINNSIRQLREQMSETYNKGISYLIYNKRYEEAAQLYQHAIQQGRQPNDAAIEKMVKNYESPLLGAIKSVPTDIGKLEAIKIIKKNQERSQ